MQAGRQAVRQHAPPTSPSRSGLHVVISRFVFHTSGTGSGASQPAGGGEGDLFNLLYLEIKVSPTYKEHNGIDNDVFKQHAFKQHVCVVRVV